MTAARRRFGHPLLRALLVGAVSAFACIAAAQTSGTWGTRPAAEEEAAYRQIEGALKDEVEVQQGILDGKHKQREAFWEDWSEAKRQQALDWFRQSGYYSPAAADDPNFARSALETTQRQREAAQQRMTRTDARDGRAIEAARGAVWEANLAVLRTRRNLLAAQVKELEFQMVGLQAYLRTWLYKDWGTFVMDGVEHLEYIFWNHAEKFWDDLIDCAIKEVGAGVKEAVLASSRFGPGRRMTPIPGVKEPPSLRGQPGQFGVVAAVDCLEDAMRASLVNATVANARKAFVDELGRRGVPPMVAEYWWNRFIREDQGAPMGPLAPKLKSAGEAMLDRLEGAAERVFSIESAKEQAKLELLARQRRDSSRILSEALKSQMSEIEEIHKAEYLQELRASRLAAADPETRAKHRRAAVEARRSVGETKATLGKKAFEADAKLKLFTLVEFLEVLMQQGKAGYDIWQAEKVFDQHFAILYGHYQEIERCLKRMGMADTPHAIIAVFEYKSEGWADFRRQCQAPTSNEFQAQLERAHSLSDRAWELVERAQAIDRSAAEQCRAATAAARNAQRLLAARGPDPVGAISALKSRLAAIDLRSPEAAKAQLGAAKAKVDTEAAALRACEAAQLISRLTTRAERDAKAAACRASAAEAQAKRADGAAQSQAARAAAAAAEQDAAALGADADSLAAAQKVLQDNAVAANAEIGRAERTLRASRALSLSLSEVQAEAKALHAQARQLLAPFSGNSQADALLGAMGEWIELIGKLANGPAACWSEGDAEIARARSSLAQASSARGAASVDPAAIRQQAAAAAQKAIDMSELAADYAEAADRAARQAEVCRDQAETLARAPLPSADPLASSGPQSGPASPDAHAADCNAQFPGSVPAWDPNTNRAACACPAGTVRDAAGKACVADPCIQLEANFAAAFNARKFSAAEGFLAQGANCSWRGHAEAALGGARQASIDQQRRELDCMRLENAILGALNGGNVAAAQGLLGQAMSMGCTVSADTRGAIQWAMEARQKEARDLAQQQALAQFTQNWQRLLERTPQPPMPSQPRPITPQPFQAPAMQPPIQPPGGGPALAGTRPQAALQPSKPQPLMNYEPRGTGSSCSAASSNFSGQCTRTNKETEQRKCRLWRNAQGCALEYPGCSAQIIYDVLYEKSCLLHPSYPAGAQTLAQRYLQEVRNCIEQYFGDRQAGAFQRGYACTQAAGQRAHQAAGQVFAQACEARCAQDGGRRNRRTDICECERPGGRP